MYNRYAELPLRVEAVWIEGLKDPLSLRPVRLGRARSPADVAFALQNYPPEVVRALFRGNEVR